TEMMVTNAARFGTEKALEPLRRVNAAGTHLLSLINEILDLSKIEAGKLELNPEPVNLSRLIDDVVGTAGQLAEKNQNRLVVDPLSRHWRSLQGREVRWHDHRATRRSEDARPCTDGRKKSTRPQSSGFVIAA